MLIKSILTFKDLVVISSSMGDTVCNVLVLECGVIFLFFIVCISCEENIIFAIWCNHKGISNPHICIQAVIIDNIQGTSNYPFFPFNVFPNINNCIQEFTFLVGVRFYLPRLFFL